MAKLKEVPIGQADIQEYLDAYSDFTFEIKVLNSLTRLGFDCRHSSVYTDPITQKMREFDIRAVKARKVGKRCSFNVFMAVECKNLQPFFPLVVHCLPRRNEEAFEEMLFSYEDDQETEVNKMVGLVSGGDPHAYYAYTIKQHHTLSMYQKGHPVGKSCDQVGRLDNHTAEIKGSDSDVFDKISQALNSSYDLVQDASRFQRLATYNISIIRPVLVVPDDGLWQVLYDSEGNVEKGPERARLVSYYYGKGWPYTDRNGTKSYNISHLDVVTVSALEEYVSCFNFEGEDLVDHLRRLQGNGIPFRRMADEVTLE